MQLIKKYKNPDSKLTLRTDSLDINGSSNPLADFAAKWQQATERGETSDPMEETRQRILDRLNNNTFYWTDTDGSIKQDYLTDDAAVEDYRRKSGTATPLNWEFNLIAPARFGLGAIGNGIRTGLQAMNTAFTPSTWLNPVTGAKLLSPTVGTIADAGVLGAFTYLGLSGLQEQSKNGTLLNDPSSTIVNSLLILPLAAPAAKVAGEFTKFIKLPGRYVFNNLPYGIINRAPYDFERVKEFFRTPLNQNPLKLPFSKKRILVGRRPVNVNSVGLYKTYVGNDLATFNKRMNGNIAKVEGIPIKDYLPLKYVYNTNKAIYRDSNPFTLLLRTPIDYIKQNLNPGYASNLSYVKLNIPRLKSLNFSTDTTIPHELAHIYRKHSPIKPSSPENFGFNSDIFPEVLSSYLKDDEILARGTLLKNYFGITDKSPITTDMLKYAAKNYVKDTGMDNNMNLFFHTITDWDKAAKYLSDFSYKKGGKL